MKDLINFCIEHNCCITLKPKGNDVIQIFITHPELEEALTVKFDSSDDLEMALRPLGIINELIVKIYDSNSPQSSRCIAQGLPVK